MGLDKIFEKRTEPKETNRQIGPFFRRWLNKKALGLKIWDKQGLIEWSDNGNPRKKIYLDKQEGKRIQDIWEMKDPQYPLYPTEKTQIY